MSVLLVLLFLLHIFLATTVQILPHLASLDKGIVFLPQPPMLTRDSHWTIAIDFSLTAYRTRVVTIHDLLSRTTALNFTEISKDTTLLSAREINQVLLHQNNFLFEKCTDILSTIDNYILTLTPSSASDFNHTTNEEFPVLFAPPTSPDVANINSLLTSPHYRNTPPSFLLNNQISHINSSTHAYARYGRTISYLTHTALTLNSHITRLSEFLTAAKAPAHRLVGLLSSTQSLFRDFEILLNSLSTDLHRFGSALTQLASHVLPSFLLSPEHLLVTLQYAQPFLPATHTFLTDLTLPSMYFYYSIATVDSTYFNNKLRIFVSIPLRTTTNYFQLYHVRSLPTYVPDKDMAITVHPPFEYFALTPDRLLYMQFNHDDLQQCALNLIYTCPSLGPVHTFSTGPCLPALFSGYSSPSARCATSLSPVFQPQIFLTPFTHLWIYSVIQESLTLNCVTNASNQAVSETYLTLTGTGTFRIPPRCQATSKNFLLTLPATASFYSPVTRVRLQQPPIDIASTNSSSATNQQTIFPSTTPSPKTPYSRLADIYFPQTFLTKHAWIFAIIYPPALLFLVGFLYWAAKTWARPRPLPAPPSMLELPLLECPPSTIHTGV